MMTTFVACFVVGAAMGTRFSFVVLLPAMFVIAAVLLIFGWAEGRAGSFMLASQISAHIGLQLGYIFGIITVNWPARRFFQPSRVPTRDAY